MIPHGVFDWVCLVYGVASVPPIVLEIRRRRKAGEVLLDLSDRNVRLLGFGALTFLLGVFELFFYAPHRSMGFLWLGWAGYNFAAGTRRLQIRRAGFFESKSTSSCRLKACPNGPAGHQRP